MFISVVSELFPVSQCLILFAIQGGVFFAYHIIPFDPERGLLANPATNSNITPSDSFRQLR